VPYDGDQELKLAKTEILIATGAFAESREWETTLLEIRSAVTEVVWPPGGASFILNPDKGRGRGQGSGVRPIKTGFLNRLERFGWSIDERRNPRRFDAVKELANGGIFGLEWETGNVSSTHRSVNRILLAHHEGELTGGAVILPTREMYQYLTDRIGNWAEIEPYFPVWRSVRWNNGVLVVVGVEHDGVSEDVPRIPKGTNGRSLV
jgi:hypothetical protein